MDHVLLRIVATPMLIALASLAARRWGHHVGGWLVALPLTSGPVAFFLAIDHGLSFAAHAAVGMMAGTMSQVAFALSYRHTARRGRTLAIATGCVAFTTTTITLAVVRLSPIPTFLLTLAVVAAAVALVYPSKRHASQVTAAAQVAPPRWDLPVRMLIATVVVLTVTALAPVIGPYAAGLLSPFPVFGAVAATMTHHVFGPRAAVSSLNGMMIGLAAPAVFFLTLALGLPTLGLPAFALAGISALGIQAVTLLTMPKAQST